MVSPFYVQPVDISSPLQGLSNTMYNIRQQNLQDEELNRQRAARQAMADAVQSIYSQHPQQSPQDQQVPMESSDQNPDNERPYLVLRPEILAHERDTLKQLGLTDSDKQDSALGFLDKFLKADPEKRASLIKDRTAEIVNRGGDASHTASLLTMSPEEQNHAGGYAQFILQNEKFRKLMAIDPKGAMELMQQYQAPIIEARKQAQEEARIKAEEARTAYWESKMGGAPGDGVDPVMKTFVTNKGTIGTIHRSGAVKDTGQAVAGYDRVVSDESPDGGTPSSPVMASDMKDGKDVPLSDYEKAIAEYRIAPPSGIAATKPENKAMMARILKAHPDYNAANYKNLQDTDRYWSQGKGADTLSTFSTALSHLDKIRQLSANLDNKDTQWQNKVANQIGAQFGDPNIDSFESAVPVVAGEITKAIVGAGGGVSEREENAVKMLSSAKTPAQFKAALDTVSDLMAGRLAAQKARHDSGYENLGRKDHPEFESRLTPEARDLFKEFQGKGKESKKTVVRTGVHNGKKVVQYSDGSIEYAN